VDAYQTAVAVFADHESAKKAVKALTAAGFDMKALAVVGKGYHCEEKVVGFYDVGDRIKFWGSRGAFWGGFWSLFFGGLFIATPSSGPVFALGFLAAVVVSGIENAVVVGALGALGAALYSIGIPKNSVVNYESDIKADKFLVMARGPAAEIDRAKSLLAKAGPSRLEIQEALAPAPVLHSV